MELAVSVVSASWMSVASSASSFLLWMAASALVFRFAAVVALLAAVVAWLDAATVELVAGALVAADSVAELQEVLEVVVVAEVEILVEAAQGRLVHWRSLSRCPWLWHRDLRPDRGLTYRLRPSPWLWTPARVR